MDFLNSKINRFCLLEIFPYISGLTSSCKSSRFLEDNLSFITFTIFSFLKSCHRRFYIFSYFLQVGVPLSFWHLNSQVKFCNNSSFPSLTPFSHKFYSVESTVFLSVNVLVGFELSFEVKLELASS